jgi:hypothetical protein
MTQPPDAYRQWLASLESMPETEAAEVLRKAFMKGTRPGGFTLARADIFQYDEHIHQYYGCQQPSPCDTENVSEPLTWEKLLMKIGDPVQYAATLAERNIEEWRGLNFFTRQNEALIRERWMKKNVSQRKAILLNAFPTMPTHHRPDIDECIIEICCHQRHINGMANYATPYLNLEDLTKPKSLLILLNARARHAPSVFAHSDHELAPLFQLRPALLEATRYTIDLISQYGDSVEWATEQAASHSIEKGETVHPLHACHILLIQATVLDFLVKCVRQILHDVLPNLFPEHDHFGDEHGQAHDETGCKMEDESKVAQNNDDEKGDSDWADEDGEKNRVDKENDCRDKEQVFPPEPLPLSDNSASYSSLEIVAREAPYRVPGLLDLGHLKALVSAHRVDAEDHIWMLREDPGYFAEIVTNAKDHRPEVLRGGKCGKVHRNGRDSVLWPRVLRNVVSDAYVNVFIWHEIHQHMTELLQLSKVYANELNDRKVLPEKFFDRLVETWFYLEAVQLEFIDRLKHGFPASPGLRAYWCLHCETSSEDMFSRPAKKAKISSKIDKDLGHMLTLFSYLWEPPKRKIFGVHTLVEVLEHLLQKNPHMKAVTSPWVASCLSQLSIVSECLRQLNLFQPWAKKIQRTVKQRQTQLLIAHVSHFAPWNRVLCTSFRGTDLVALGKPGLNFQYPVDKRRTRAHVETMRAAEASLDAFWQAADNHFRRQAGNTPHDLITDIIQERTLQRTPPWVEPEHSSRTEKPSESPEYIYVPFSTAPHDPTKQITGVFNKLTVATNQKIKRHGVPGAECGVQQEAEIFPTEDTQPAFHLDKRAHKVFRNLFHSPLSRDQPGEIPWADFLHAMVSTGFAAQKLQGSAWQFTPRNRDVEQPIQFHEPHPNSKLPFTWARRFGRRLSRTYGWRGDMFRLA